MPGAFDSLRHHVNTLYDLLRLEGLLRRVLRRARRLARGRTGRLSAAVVLIALGCLAVETRWPVEPGIAHAEADCGKVIPIDAVAGATESDSADGSYGPAAGLAVVKGRATLSAAATAKAAAAAAVFFATMYGTCEFLDWTNWFEDPVPPIEPLVGDNEVSRDDGYQCNTSSATAFTDRFECMVVSFPVVLSGTIYWRANIGGTFSVGANSFPSATYSALYPTPVSGSIPGSTDSAGWSARDAGWENIRCGYTSGGTNCFNHNVPASVTYETFADHCVNGADVNGAATGGFTEFWNVGGACGQHPSRYFVGYDPNPSPAQTRFLFHPYPVARDWGWERRVFTDIQCKNGAGGVTTWVRAVSTPFLDRAPSARTPVPHCPDGYVPVDMIVTHVPTPITCNVGVICLGNDSVVIRITMPAALTTVGTAPAWLACLSAGNDCGVPAMVGADCVWGGYVVPASYCDPEEQVNNGTDPRTEVRRDPEVDLPTELPTTGPVDTALLEPAPEEPGGGGPGTGVTVEVPIDEGRGEGAIPLDGDDEECWPDGWGWFNPAEWVYRPIKCALGWAFVPQDGFMADQFGGLNAALEEQLPFSLLYMLIDFASDMEDSISASSASGCFETGGSFNFGPAVGEVPMDDVCIGAGAGEGGGWSLSTENRQLLAALLVTGIWYSVVLHAVRTVRGVVQQGDDQLAAGS